MTFFVIFPGTIAFDPIRRFVYKYVVKKFRIIFGPEKSYELFGHLSFSGLNFFYKNAFKKA